MADVNETRLPGVGIRYDFECLGGQRVGVITRHSGRRELIIYDRDDPDAVRSRVELSVDESRTLGELLGGSRINEQLTSLVSEVEGLAIDWLPLAPSFEPRTIGSTEMRQRTGASIIAIIRGDEAIPSPGPDDELRPNDTVVIVGTAEGLAEASRLLGS
ncbi:cation:proton antiporter regulatory subunit [Rhabdothermincola sp.]|jgi:TrkA domain protein|uniref:cation:proton antiporter regulatory subunit n=1 Tax=Rhabdothermincola sp. TaxID=2820405 RepID=UPI002FE23388